MKVEDYDFSKFKNSTKAKQALVRLLQNAHAGEKAAANAYWGHARSLFIWNKEERKQIIKIYEDELHHRRRLFDFLQSLDSKPRLIREIGMWCVGASIAILSIIGTWFIPMYGAGQLESTNIGEYEVAARLALLAGREELIEELLVFAEVEWDHEDFFRKKVEDHWVTRYYPLWNKPARRDSIRSLFNSFQADTKQ